MQTTETIKPIHAVSLDEIPSATEMWEELKDKFILPEFNELDADETVNESLRMQKVEEFEKLLTSKALEVYDNRIPHTVHEYTIGGRWAAFKNWFAFTWLGRLFGYKFYNRKSCLCQYFGKTIYLDDDNLVSAIQRMAALFNALVEMEVIKYGVLQPLFLMSVGRIESRPRAMIMLYAFSDYEQNQINQICGNYVANLEGELPTNDWKGIEMGIEFKPYEQNPPTDVKTKWVATFGKHLSPEIKLIYDNKIKREDTKKNVICLQRHVYIEDGKLDVDEIRMFAGFYTSLVEEGVVEQGTFAKCMWMFSARVAKAERAIVMIYTYSDYDQDTFHHALQNKLIQIPPENVDYMDIAPVMCGDCGSRYCICSARLTGKMGIGYDLDKPRMRNYEEIAVNAGEYKVNR